MLRPILDHVVVRKLKPSEMSRGGILLVAPEDKSPRGIVVAVGPGRLMDRVREPVAVKVGDMVVFPLMTGAVVDDDGEPMLVLAEHNILAIVEREEVVAEEMPEPEAAAN
jgi:co-chaperonin GroES (HSP10)